MNASSHSPKPRTRLLNIAAFVLLLSVIAPKEVSAQSGYYECMQNEMNRQGALVIPDGARERCQREQMRQELDDYQVRRQYEQMQQQQANDEDAFKCRYVIDHTSPSCPYGGKAAAEQRQEYVERYRQIFGSGARYLAQWQQEVKTGKRTEQSLKDAWSEFIAKVQQDVQAQQFQQLANQGANLAYTEIFEKGKK